MTTDGPFHLLLVEDNPGHADLVRGRFAAVPNTAFEVIHVMCLGEALETLARVPIHVVLLNLNLPDSSGIETLRRLRRVREDVAIVVLVSHLSEELRSLVYREGAQDVIGKDDPPERLLGRSVLYAFERHRAQERQRNAQKLMAAIPDGVVVVDRGGAVQFVNEAALALFGTRREDFVGERLGFSVRDEQGAEIEIVSRSGRRTAQMRVVDVEWHGQPASLASIRDITEEKKLGEQLRHAQKMEALGQLAGGVAHDFNNLLTVILGFTQMLLEQMPGHGPFRPWIHEIHKSANRGASLTQQLLAFSRKSVLSSVPLNLNTLISEMSHLLLRLIGEDIDLIILPDPALGQVIADPSQIEQIIMNLALNARDAMATGGRLMIETQSLVLTEANVRADADIEPGAYARLSISDNGTGMSPEVMSRIFEPFFTTKELGKGTGLGLATVYGIIKQSNGHINVSSEPGHGTTFKIYLPMLLDTAHPPAGAVTPFTMPTGHETILLVDDDEGIRSLSRLVLESSGYQVLAAAHGQEALRLAERCLQPIHLLLTDVVMPHMSGYHLAESLCHSRPELKILYMSGYADDAIGRYGVVQALTPTLKKPFTPSTLAQKVREVLDSPGFSG
jgi:signal transduction histidine kinase